jgi:hypothetical protein
VTPDAKASGVSYKFCQRPATVETARGRLDPLPRHETSPSRTQ